MATRKIKDAKDLSTQELIYFKGHAKATFMSDGATVEDAVRAVENATYKNKGYFPTLAELQSAFPEGSAGSRAYVGSTYPYSIYLWQNGAWVDSGATGGDESVDLASYYTKSETDTKLTELSIETKAKTLPLYASQVILEDGYYYPTSNTMPSKVSASYMQSVSFCVFKGQELSLIKLFNGDPSFKCWQLYDTNGNLVAASSENRVSEKIVITSDGVLCVNNLLSNNGAGIYLSSKLDALEGQISIVYFTKIDGYIDNVGNVVSGSYWHSAPILFKSGTKIKIQTANRGWDYIAYETDAEGSFYEPLIPTTPSPYIYEYTFRKDTYIALNGYANNDIDLYALRGLESRVEGLEMALSKVDVEEQKKLIVGRDYIWNNGNIRDDGTIEMTTSYWYSTPIKVNGGDVVSIKKNYGVGVNAINETNAEGLYHRPLYKNVEGVDEYKFAIERDCYISFCHNAQFEGAGVIFEAYIISGGVSGCKGASEGYTDNKIQFLDKTTDTSFLSLAKDLDYKVTDEANIRKALFDREVMLYEVKNSTDADILAQGVCGYDDSKGTRVDGTITWKIYKNGILYISGYGKTYDYIKGVMDGLNKAQVEAYQAENPTMWYYGFVKEGIEYVYSDTGFKGTYTSRVYDEVTGEKADPATGNYKGYAAPFYKYRSEIDFDEYTTHAIYDSHNPQGIKYNRICFEEDLSKGGITSLGDWFLYRCCVDSIVLPTQLTELRRWAVRYSPTTRVVVMGDKVTFVEEYGLSRMESMETLKLSKNIERLDYSAFVQNSNLRHMELPKVSYIEKWGVSNNQMLESLDISSLTYLRNNTLGQNYSLQRVVLSESLNTIEANNFYKTSVQELIIPRSIVTILNSAMAGMERLQKVVILSNTISSTIWNNDSHLFSYAKRYEIPVGNEINEYIWGTLKYMGVEDGYHIFIKL